MLRLDHNRALSQLANKAGVAVADIEKLVVWGNHSPTMYPDYRFATVGGASLKDKIGDADWNANTFIPTVGKRGAAIIEARGLSSAALGGQCRDRPHARLGAGHRRQVGDHGRAVGRQLRHPGRRDVRRAGDLRERRVHPHRGPAGGRLQPRRDGQDAGRTRGRARGVAHLL